tara:strand:+ start:621 stop:1217 length:597 start_codon:yes stop_codon:yes gene_type:complete
MALTQIKGSNIEDGTVVAADVATDAITNVKVAANAAIATSKISGLGTAAALAVGTGASQIVQMTTAPAKLPVVDGSNLTGLVSLAVGQSWTAGQRGEITALTDGATIAVDFAASNHFSVTLAGNRTLANPTNIVAGQSGCIFVSQDGTGSRTLAYGSYWDFAAGTAPVLTTTASAVDRVDYIVRTSTSIHAVATLAYS